MGRRPRVTRVQVLDAARETFAARGYDGATLAAIAEKLGISPAAILRHAPTKRALFIAAMVTSAPRSASPLAFLVDVGDDEDPHRIIRRVAHSFVPFVEKRLGESIARWQYTERTDEALRERSTMTERVLRELETYFRRATKRGRLRIRDPEAAAVSLLGSLQAYVFFSVVLRAIKPPIPLDRYVDTLADVWTRGAVRPGRMRR